jgi:8-oxo-dGTP diphosphatase
MITRKNNPFKGCYALPGGFLDYNEDPKDGCLRELLEETCIEGKHIELLTVVGEP